MLKKYQLYYKKPNNKNIKDFLIIVLITILILLSLRLKTYEEKEIIAIYSCEEECLLSFPLSYQELEIINHNTIIKYQDKYINIENYTKGEPYLDNGIAYEDIEIKTSLETDNKIVKIKVYYKEERIIKKIIKLIGG
jgi:hypothetical protein